jgi:hypothetical protein
MFDIWYELPPWLRATAGSILIGIAVLMFLGGIGIRLPAILGGTGLVCVLFSKAGHDDSGYNF